MSLRGCVEAFSASDGVLVTLTAPGGQEEFHRANRSCVLPHFLPVSLTESVNHTVVLRVFSVSLHEDRELSEELYHKHRLV